MSAQIAADRLADALKSWDERSSFLYYMTTMEAGQDEAFSAVQDLLDSVARDADESYRSWTDLERELIRYRDYANLRAYIQQAVDLAAK